MVEACTKIKDAHTIAMSALCSQPMHSTQSVDGEFGTFHTSIAYAKAEEYAEVIQCTE